jgi:hypothetical protein
MPQCQFPIFCYFCVSEKLHRKYSWNQTKWSPKFIFPPTRDGVQRRVGGGPGGGHTIGWHPLLGRATTWCGPPWCPLTLPLRLYKASNVKTLRELMFSQIKFHSATSVEDSFQGTEVSMPAPCRDGEFPPQPPPSTPPPSPSMLLSPMMRRE